MSRNVGRVQFNLNADPHVCKWRVIECQPKEREGFNFTIALIRCKECLRPDSILLHGEWSLELLRLETESAIDALRKASGE
jgi:hypothetical protein